MCKQLYFLFGHMVYHGLINLLDQSINIKSYQIFFNIRDYNMLSIDQAPRRINQVNFIVYMGTVLN